MTECSGEPLEFHALGRQAVLGKFDGGMIRSDCGGLLLAEVEARTGILARFAEQFTDHRDPEAIEHSVRELVAQRVLGLALGYEDLNDHNRLRLDRLLAVLVGKEGGVYGVNPRGTRPRCGRGRRRARKVCYSITGQRLVPLRRRLQRVVFGGWPLSR